MADEYDDRAERIIWKGAGVKSNRQLSEETGLPVDEVHRIKVRLFQEIDDLTIQQRMMKLMVTLQEIANGALDAAQNVQDERNLAGLYNSAASATDKLLKQLQRMQTENTGKVEALNQLRQQEILNLMTDVVDRGVEEIAERYELPLEDLFSIFNNQLVISAQALEARHSDA